MSGGQKPPSDRPVLANFDSSHLTIAAGVAIFHLASARVVLCWHGGEKYWFLPKGRRDASEDSGAGGEREGFEEVKRRPPLSSCLRRTDAGRVVWLSESTAPAPAQAPPAAGAQPVWGLGLAVCHGARMDAAGPADGDVAVCSVLVCGGNGAPGGGNPTQ